MNIENYKLVEKSYIDELKSQAYIYEHEKTKARVLYIENEDEIKTFSIGFKTPPTDSTGVAHILEHSVLSGSRKYKTKEPFMDMINSSMQTFLNAMTFPDKTIYPVASRNEKDFFNLMDVYLDAVFYPAIYEEEKIFKQEGIHLEMQDMDSDITYNGVVYNEMRGNYSDPESQVLELLAHKLHPDSSYAHDSGGNPYHIIDLTQEDMLDFHSRYYHPSNSYIFLSGKMDIEGVLTYMDQEYLGQFDYQDPKAQIQIGQRFESPQEIETVYSLGQSESTEGKNYLVYGVDLGLSTSVEDNILADVLGEILMDLPSSVLKEKLLESQIAEDYYAYKSSSLPLDLYFVAKNAKDDSIDKFVNLIEENLKVAIDEKIDKDLVLASLNRSEFAYKDLGAHKGVYLNIMALESWLYGASPIDGLSFKKSFDKIRDQLDEGYIENFIQERILDNPQKIKLIARPEPGLFAKKDQDLKEDLVALKESMTQDEKSKLIEVTKDLFAYQLEEDSLENKATIPQLNLEDISEGVGWLDTKIDESTYPKLHTRDYTDGIYYSVANFNLKVLKEEDLYYAGLVHDMLGLLDTKNYSYQDLQTQKDIHTGGISFFSSVTSNKKTKEFDLATRVGIRALPEKISKSHELCQEIILNTSFEDTKRIKDLITMRRSTYEGSIEQAGHANISSELRKKIRQSAYFASILNGNDYYFFLKDLEARFDEDKDQVVDKLYQVYKNIFNQDMVISVAGEDSWYDQAEEFYDSLREKLDSLDEVLEEADLDRDSVSLKNSSSVVYVGEAYDLGMDYKGDLAVLAKILGGGYLHSNIRAKGGAYGSAISISTSGLLSLASYRDPNLDKTYDVYDHMPKTIGELDLSKRDLDNYIISTMNSFDPPLTPIAYVDLALNRYLSDTTRQEMEDYKAQAINTTIEDLRAYGQVFENARQDRVYGVLGSRDIIDQAKTSFDQEIDLNK